MAHVDAMVGRLLSGLQARKLMSCVNIILVADHGMVEAGQNRAILLDQFIPNVVNRTRFWSGIFGRMTPNDGRKGKVQPNIYFLFLCVCVICQILNGHCIFQAFLPNI